MNRIILTIAFLACCSFLPAQSVFPTATGTQWEFFQYYETMVSPVQPRACFKDLVVGDTLAGGNSYKVVRRTGDMFNAFGSTPTFDPMGGTWYYRVVGDEVWLLDSVSLGTAHESVLYDFDTLVGTTLPTQPKSLIEVIPGRVGGYYLPYHSRQYMCDSMGMVDACTLAYNIQGVMPFFSITQSTFCWNQYCNNKWLPGIGTVFAEPFLIVLDVYGQHYLLGRLSQGATILYENNDFRLMAREEPLHDLVSVFPNPAGPMTHVEAKVDVDRLRLQDALGRVLWTHGALPGGSRLPMDLGGLPAGPYWLRIEGAGGVTTQMVLHR